MAKRPAVFLDRDGTLVIDHGYVHRIEDFAWVNGAEQALRRLHQLGIPVLVATNQGGVGLGLYTESDLRAFHSHLRTEAWRAGGNITDIAYCVHHPRANAVGYRTPCLCRKPAPGMLLDLAERWQIDLGRSVMIGDQQSDVDAGRAAGCQSYLFEGLDLDVLIQMVLCRHFLSPGS